MTHVHFSVKKNKVIILEKAAKKQARKERAAQKKRKNCTEGTAVSLSHRLSVWLFLRLRRILLQGIQPIQHRRPR